MITQSQFADCASARDARTGHVWLIFKTRISCHPKQLIYGLSVLIRIKRKDGNYANYQYA